MNISKRELYAAGEPLGDCVTQRRVDGRVICGGGGSGGGTSTTIQSIPTELKPLATAYTNKAINLGGQSWTPYSGERYADMNPTQLSGINMIEQRALSGDQLQNTGYNYLGNMLTSGPQSATRNPYGYTSAGVNNTQVRAGVNNASINAGRNPYLSQNQYLNQNIDAALGDVARNYNQNVRPGQVGANVSSGSFGNSGLAEVQAMQENDLQRQMGNIASGMRMQDYGMQQQLAEAGLDRSMSAQQANAQLGEANLGRYMQSQLANLGTAESNLARQMQTQQFNSQMGQDWASRNDSMYQNYMGNNLNALGLANTYGNQQYQDAAQLMNAGQLVQDQDQQGRDFQYQQFLDQQNNPYKQLAAMAGVFGSNLGSSSTTTQSGGGK